MAKITLGGTPCETNGNVPAVGTPFPDFTLTNLSLKDVKLSSFDGKRVLNIFPSVNTEVCATSVRMFNQEATKRDDVTVLNVSADLPFALKKFRANEGIERALSLSSFRSSFAKESGLGIVDGPFAGLLSRVVIVLDEDGVVLHAEQVGEIGDEPNYEAALASL